MKRITIQELRAAAPALRAGEEIHLSGTIYTARDAVHKRLMRLIAEGAPLPFEIRDAVVYHAGPTPAPEGLPIGSCGPTTSSRMDPYAPTLYDMGLLATIGKGDRAPAVYDAIVRNGGLYLCALGGAGALCAGAVRECEVCAFPELGCESVKRLVVEDFSVFVGIDTRGNSIFPRVESSK